MALSRILLGTVLCGLMALQLNAAQSVRASADAAGYMLDWQPGPASVVSQHDSHGEWLNVEFEGAGFLGQPGSPDLPLLSRMIEIPDDAGVSVELVNAEWQSVSGVVAPNQSRLMTPEDFPPEWIQNEEVYGADAWFPSNVLHVSKPMLARNLRMVKVDLVPVRTNPVSGETEVLQSARVRVNFAGTDLRNARTHELPMDQQMYRTVLGAELVQLPEHEADRSIFEVPETPGNYLIFARNTTITNDPFFVNWVSWKREKGHDVQIATESMIGGWDLGDILGEIEDRYFGDTPPLYIVLIGDPNASGTFNLPTSTVEYDHYFAEIDGDDLIEDVAIGRISVENSNQLRTVMNKLMMYETTPTAHSSDWLGDAAMMTGYYGLSMIQQSRSLCNDMIANGITHIDTVWHPDGDVSWVNQRFAEGICLYNYRGYLNMNGLNESYFSNTSVFQNSARTPVTAIFTCNTSSFYQPVTGDTWTSGPCETELFLRWGDIDDPRGASAALGFATSGTHTRYNNVIVAGFWGAFLDHGLAQVGSALAFGKYELVTNLPPGTDEAADFSYWGNLMGDPGMDMWCGVPGELVVSHNFSGNIPLGATGLDSYVSSGGTAVAGATVCAYQEGVLQSVGITDASGHVLLDLSDVEAGSMMLTATKLDYLPSRNALTVSQFAQYPSLVDAGINGDGIANPAEGLILLPTVHNTGSAAITFLTASLSLDAEYGNVSDASASWPVIASGAQVAATGSFALELSGDLPDGTMVPAQITFNTGSETFEDVLWIEVNAPRPVVSALTFNGSSPIAQPGVTSSMELELTNLGSFSASGISFTLGAGDCSYITITDASSGAYNAAPGATDDATFGLDVDVSALRGLPVSLPLSWVSSTGISGETTVDFVIGTSTELSPTGPDAYGYIAVENTDMHTHAQSYQWIEVASPAGGSGTALGLTDFGTEQDDAATIALPFDFVYYGQTYDEVAVCSNGFLSFEEGAVDQTDFRNHYLPSGTGPDCMIAVMWDDLKQSGNADVYYYYDSANHQFIIEWYDFTLNEGGDNTFQIILYDEEYYNTSSGDSPFLMQYQTWSNNQSQSYDFPYCSIGIEDETASIGLTITNYNVDAVTISGMASGKALYFTTELGGFDADESNPPQISIGSPGTVEPGETAVIHADILDQSGIAWAKLFWSINHSTYTEVDMLNIGGSTWSASIPEHSLGTVVWYYVQAQDLAPTPNQSTTGTANYTVVDGTPPCGPSDYGYFIYDSEDAGEAHGFSWVSVPGDASSLSLSDDAVSVVSLPFNVSFYGVDYDEVSICSNGFLCLGDDNTTSYMNGGLPDDSPGQVIAAFWDDLNPSGGGDINYWYEAGSSRFFVTYTAVPHYGQGSDNLETFQIVFHDTSSYPTITGDTPILIQYHTVTDNSSCTVGIAEGTSRGLQYVFNGTYDEDAALIDDGQALWITTGEMIVMPDPVTDLEIAYTGGQLVLSWTPTGADQYRVYEGSSAYGSITQLVGTTAASSMNLGSASGTSFYQVRGVNGEMLLSTPRSWGQVLATYSTSKTNE